jgi:FecR protein
MPQQGMLMNNRRIGFSIAAFAAAILLLLSTSVITSAQDQNYDQDPPARAGRISFVEGSVSFQPGGEGDWVTAVPNRTLTVGDNLWVDRDSRAEIQIGSTSIRLGPETSLTFLDVEDNVTQLRLSVGSVYARVRHFDNNDNFEVDTPNLAFNLDREGQFRVDVNENGDQTVASVFRGEAEITGAGSSYRLSEGQQGTFSGTDQLTYDVAGIGGPDGFTQWAMSRDDRFDRSRSRQYVSPEMTGYEDLDDYGQWRNVPDYGWVWSPARVDADWAPYRNGHWAYVSPWGWTWVEDEPWGFAPFHYGRWAFVGNSWCWAPGPVQAVPVYSPALVAFVGGGGFNLSVGIGGGGGVGWFPLGPGEVYVPWYHTSPRYVQNVNVTNTRVSVTQVTNVYNNVTVNKVTNITYVNQKNVRAVTVVNHDTFVNARPVRSNVVRVDQRQMQQIASAPVTHNVVRDIKPQRESLVGGARPIDRKPPQQVMTRQVVATRQPEAMNRPPAVPGVERRAAPPAVRTVKAAPRGQAQPLEKGAKGTARPNAMNNEPGRPGGPPENRPNANPRPGENRPNAGPNGPENRPNAGPENRPNAGPENRPNVPRPGVENRPNENRPNENRPNEPNRPNENRPDNNRAVPRPGGPDNNNRPDNNRPEARPNENPRLGQPENRPNNMGNRPGQENQPDNNRAAPRPGNRPDQTPEQERPNAKPENNNRPSETPSARPEQPSRTPENRQEPPRNQNRPDMNQGRQERPNASGNENRPAAAPPADRNVPRPEARPSDNRGQQQRGNERNNNPDRNNKENNKDNKDKDKNKPPQFR